LARREYGRGELVSKLVTRGCDESLARTIADELVSEGLVSDQRFVEALVHARRSRGYGPLYIRRELEQKGVGRELIARWVRPRDAEWLDDLKRVKRKKFGGRLPSSLAERAKQTRFFQSRGFTHDQIRHVLGGSED